MFDAVYCLLDSVDAAPLTDADVPALLGSWLLVAAEAVLPLLAATEAAISPEPVGGSGVSGSAKGVQSGGPASKGEDLARCRPQADPTRAGPLPGEALLLELLLSASLSAACAAAVASLPKRVVRSLLAAAAAEAGVSAAGVLAAGRETVGAAVPGTAAAAVKSTMVLLLVARAKGSLGRPTFSVK